MPMVEMKKEVESVYRLHIIQNMYSLQNNKIIKAVIRIPKEMSEEELLAALLNWKAEEPRQKIKIARTQGILALRMKDILSFKVMPYQPRPNGERQLIFDETARQRLL
ncbi:hypothetical protein HCJ39_07005 [Listeria rocourtiae]|uniref:hypothetical protein n=1 Tax=Listeria rocourtiae TaxID=647910 RepID=UPI00162482D1|nr:hypothetical protein [Listeria rocourtiae]MBC1604458.1 hypothetical protein [Listeria rocourtiae]